METFSGNNSLKQLANNVTDSGFLQCPTARLFIRLLRNHQTQRLECKMFPGITLSSEVKLRLTALK